MLILEAIEGGAIAPIVGNIWLLIAAIYDKLHDIIFSSLLQNLLNRYLSWFLYQQN